MEKTETEKIIERIKTLEDAMEATGMTLHPEEQLVSLPKDVVAYMKLRIIAAALNGLTKDTLHEYPTFDEMECRYFPWFKIYSESEIRNKTSKEESLLLWGALAATVRSPGSSARTRTTLGRLRVRTLRLALL